MKNLANILRRADITPKERVLTLIKNEVQKDKDGKGILSDSEIYSITQGWKPKNSYEVNEYNKYLNLMRLEESMRFDAQMFACRSENLLLRSGVSIKDIKYKKSDAKESNIIFNKYISQEDAVDFAIKNTYLDYATLIHSLTFNNLPKDIRDDLLILDEYIAHDKKYFEDEVFLFKVFENSETLSLENKKILIDRIYSCIYSSKYRKIKKGSEKDGFMPLHFFAELPVGAVLIKWSEYANITLDFEDSDHTINTLNEYAKDNNKTMESVIKETLSRWIDEGLFIKEYIPPFFSNDHNTWNGNTKLTHKQIFNLWIEELQKTKIFIDKMIADGDLDIKYIEEETGNIKILTGESLYNCKVNLDFITEYKEQINILSPLVGMYLFIDKYNKPLDNLETLRCFYEISEKVSNLFEVSITDRYNEFLSSFKLMIKFTNQSISISLDNMDYFIYTENNRKFPIQIKENCFLFDVDDKQKGVPGDIVEVYKKEIEKMGFVI